MCCMFTCFGWMVDLIQRLWVFAMTCCIFTAVCCALITTSMSGVALGYNYSLAEYMELKETNVSVYMKRGVFDDEVADSANGLRTMAEAQRSGDNQMNTDTRSGPNEIPALSRRLDDSLVMSDDSNKYEGQLMRLTAKTLFTTAAASQTESIENHAAESKENYRDGSVGELKAIQAQINMRKAFAARDPNVKYASTTTTTQKNGVKWSDSVVDMYRKRLDISSHPGEDNKVIPPILATSIKPEDNIWNIKQKFRDYDQLRRMNDKYPAVIRSEYEKEEKQINPARLAVPGPDIGNPTLWSQEAFDFYKKFRNPDLDSEFKIVSPATVYKGIIRPTHTTLRTTVKVETSTADVKIVEVKKVPEKQLDTEIDKFKEDIMFDSFEGPKIQSDDESKSDKDKTEIDYYDDDIKGLPVKRRRRNVVPNNIKELNHDSSPPEPNKLKLEETNVLNKIPKYRNSFLSKLILYNKLFSNDPSSKESEGQN